MFAIDLTMNNDVLWFWDGEPFGRMDQCRPTLGGTLRLDAWVNIVKMVIFILPLNHIISLCLSNLLDLDFTLKSWPWRHLKTAPDLSLWLNRFSSPPRTVLSVTIQWYSHPVQLRNQQIPILMSGQARVECLTLQNWQKISGALDTAMDLPTWIAFSLSQLGYEVGLFRRFLLSAAILITDKSNVPPKRPTQCHVIQRPT
jgi:hypothetical protein